MTRLRKKQGLTMGALAQAVNVSESYISLLESGERKQPSRELVLKLASALGARNNRSLTDDFLVTAGYFPSHKPVYSSHMETLNAYQSQYQQNPNDFNRFSLLLFALIKMGETQTAQAMIHQGLTHFDQTQQEQTLLASLELAKHNYAQALRLQSTVCEQYCALAENEPETQKQLQFNLAMMHFFYGLHHEQQWQKAGPHKQSERCESLRTDAQDHFSRAREILYLLVQTQPEDVFSLAELARVCFKLAQLSPEASSESKPLWEESIQTLQAVLHSEQKYSLGREVLLENSLFLAQAYSKIQAFAQAETLLNILEFAITPPHGMVFYAKSRFFTRRYLHTAAETDLNLALEFLQQANQVDASLIRPVALHDPELSTLRVQKTMEFRRIFL